jgi:2-oxoglutarate ferredoxin oxidoreductase subunit alpha
VSSLHLTFIQPLPSGIRDILRRFKRVMTVEGNWADRLDDELVDADNRRYAALAMMLRSRYLVDVDCWTQSRGQPMKPGAVAEALRAKLAEPVAENVAP